MTDDLLDAVRDLPKVCPYLHVPAQSGCNDVLKRMKRLYTVEYYREMLARCREIVPDVAISSDFIVGFCGETEESFRADMRPGARRRASRTASSSSTARAPAPRGTSCTPTTCPRKSRNAATTICLAIQNAVSLQDHREHDRPARVEVLVEGPSKTASKHDRAGPDAAHRPHDDRPHRRLRRQPRLVGQTVAVDIDEATSFTLFGNVVTGGADWRGPPDAGQPVSDHVTSTYASRRIGLPLRFRASLRLAVGDLRNR